MGIYDGDGNLLTPKPNPWKNLSSRAKGTVIAIVAIIGGIAAVLTSLKTIRDAVPVPPPPLIGFAKLCDIEQGLIPTFTEGKERHSSLIGYFREANNDLFNHVSREADAHRRGEKRKGATYVAGSSGVGKSFVIGELPILQTDIAGPIRLAEIYKNHPQVPDLHSLDGKTTYNSLPSVASSTLDFIAHLESVRRADGNVKPFVLIDDLDELDEASSRLILEWVEVFLQKSTGEFVHIIVFGRPEAFWPWLNNPKRDPPPYVTNRPFVLHGPRYETFGDLAFRTNQYHQRKTQRDAPPELIDEMRKTVLRHPYLGYTLRPLSAGNFLIEAAMARCSSKDTAIPTDEQVRSGLFSDLLSRNNGSHGRPAHNDDQYLAALELAAAFPLGNGRPLDKQGYFEVLTTDHITFTDRNKQSVTVKLQSLLNRSGLIMLDPSDLMRTRYRFEPFWVQMHLIELLNRRNRPGHVYRISSD